MRGLQGRIRIYRAFIWTSTLPFRVSSSGDMVGHRVSFNFNSTGQQFTSGPFKAGVTANPS